MIVSTEKREKNDATEAPNKMAIEDENEAETRNISEDEEDSDISETGGQGEPQTSGEEDNSHSEVKGHTPPANWELEYVEPALNFQGNYHNYVSMVLKSLVPLRSLNLTNTLDENNIILPDSDLNKKTLILDLDETLIHSDFDSNYPTHDHVVSFTYEDQEVMVPIILRPGLMHFLENIAEVFEVFVFTASKREYADAILDFLDPENRIFKRRFYREHCINIRNRIFVKDLRVFVNRKLENIILVDNSLYSFSNQLSNGILINSFYNDKEDRELFNLFNYLQQYIRPASDSRAVNEKIFNFNLIFEEYLNMQWQERNS